MKGADEMTLVVDSSMLSYQTIGMILSDLKREYKDTIDIDKIVWGEEVREDILIQYINGKRKDGSEVVLLVDDDIDFDEIIEKGEEYAEGGLEGEER